MRKHYKDDKNKQGFSLNFDFDDIDFEAIGTRIKNSVNSAFRGLKDGFKNESLPAVKDPEVCEQKNPIGPEKYTGLKVLALASGAAFLTLALAAFTNGYGGLMQILIGSAFVLAGLGTPIILWEKANENKRLAINYDRYKRELGDRTVASIRDLASAVGQSEERTVKDILYFMKQDYFKQARIVEDDSIFILDIPTFRLYKQKVTGLPYYKRAALEEDDSEEVSVESINKDQADSIIESSDKILEKMNAIGSNIRSRTFKDKLSKLFSNISDILDLVKRYPDKAVRLNKFADYYMPTSLKLIETYEEFEMMNTDDPKILKSMAEIDTSIGTIAEAFDNIKVDLLSDRAMDVKTDIDTINLILGQEGLLEDDWRSDE